MPGDRVLRSTFVEKALKLAQPDLESLVMEHHLKDRSLEMQIQHQLKRMVQDVQDAQALLELFCSTILNIAQCKPIVHRIVPV